MPLAELVRPAVDHAREGVAVNAEQAYLFKILEPILTHQPEGRAIYAPEGRRLREGDLFRFAELAEALERYGAEGPEPFYRGEIAAAVSEWVVRARRHPRASRTWPPTSRSRDIRPGAASAAARCSPTRRPPRGAS